MSAALVQQAAGRARAWLVDQALPFWGTAGVDDQGGFHEKTDFAGQPDLTCPRRMRVQARQLYVFSEAAVRGWWGPARAVADRGFDTFARTCWAPDGQPGFVHLLTPDLTPLDPKRDAYDHAFGLFALAWYYKATGAPRALTLAHEALDFMQDRLADGNAGGFVESVPPALPRRADPHMHLLEAMLAWSEFTGQARFLDIARRMTGLFHTHFFDRATGTLGEYFGPDLTPAAGADGQVTMPGHHFEWNWLLAWARARGADQGREAADRLYAFARGCGLDALGLAIDETDRNGAQVRASRRAWPQTELIKAHINKAREGLEGAAEAAADVTITFLDSYLATDAPGLWMDQFDAEGRGMTGYVPASTLYHIVVAFRELMLFAEGG
ncbi:MAG TPA: AGE family epimerase/isomerase [Caulobacteraceae bacterium]|nr:AGE family epimerase/isomerase [Caulobacteraceae bacterium]